MFDLAPYREAIGRVCAELRVRSLALVGSAARADFDPARSDVDLLVEFDGRDRLFDRYFGLKQHLERSMGRTVDLIEPAAVRNPIVKQHLQRRKVLLYGT